MSAQTQAALELRCPDHPGHIMTRSGYCIKGDHMPTKPGIPVSRTVWSVPTEPKLESEVETVTTDLDIAVADAMIRRHDPATGELQAPAQMTLGAMFKQYEAPNVRVNSSGGHVLSLETLRDMTEGKPLIPGMAVECTFSGYICGAGLKWRKGGEGKEANLNINLDDLLILRVMGETIEEEDPEQDWEDEHDD